VKIFEVLPFLASPFITFLYYRNYIRLFVFCSTNNDKLNNHTLTKLSGKERHTFIFFCCNGTNENLEKEQRSIWIKR